MEKKRSSSKKIKTSKKVENKSVKKITKSKSRKKVVKKEPVKKLTKKSLLKKSSIKGDVISFFVETLKSGSDRWIKSPDYPTDWNRGIIKNRKQGLSLLKSLEIPSEVKSLLTICINKSIRLSEVVVDGYEFPLEVDHEGYAIGKEVTFENLEEYFEVVDDDHDDSDYKRYYHEDVIHFKKHNIYIKEDSEGVHERPPYRLQYSLTKPRKSVRYLKNEKLLTILNKIYLNVTIDNDILTLIDEHSWTKRGLLNHTLESKMSAKKALISVLRNNGFSVRPLKGMSVKINLK